MNVPCLEIRSLFDQFLDGDLRKKERSRVKKHLKECPACRSELAKEREVGELFTALPEIRCPERVTRRIEEATLGRKTKDSLFRRIKVVGGSYHWRTVSVGVAVVALVFLFVVHPYINREPPVQGPYSQEEVLEARNQAKWSLAYLAKTMNRTEKEVIENVLLKDIPQTVRKSIKNAVPIFRGGQ